MAFTESELNKLVMVLRVQRVQLDYVLRANESLITAEVEADVRALLDKWDASLAGFTRFTPTESNRGFNLNAGDAKNDIRRNIALLLGMDLNELGYGQGRLVRC